MKQLLSTRLRMAGKAFRDPGEVWKRAVYRIKETLLWDHYYAALREPKSRCAVPNDPDIQDEILRKLRSSNFRVIDFKIDITDYRQYLNSARYQKFPIYYGGGKGSGFIEKSLEHYLAARLLNLHKNDIYVDIASSNSPAPIIYHNLFGCKIYRQDMIFPKGIHGNVIGGDASNMPVEDGFFSKMALHCSFEHFENGSDIRFIKEAGRVLKKGGKLCILPLYLFNEYAIQTDPAALPKGGIPFERNAVLYCAKGWRNRHSRFYDIPNLTTRIGNNLDSLKLVIYVVQNEKEVDPSCYVKFMALLEKA